MSSPANDLTKKRGLMSMLFGSRSTEQAKRRVERMHSVDVSTFRRTSDSDDVFGSSSSSKGKSQTEKKSVDKKTRKQSVPTPTKNQLSPRLVRVPEASDGNISKKKSSRGGCDSRGLRHRKNTGGSSTAGVKLTDLTSPLDFPATPELILEHHRRKPFLNQNEEWLIVELNEYQCLVDSMEIVKIIAKHSKFFEVEPDELWEEFFEFVEDVPSYDEIVNYDVWQEFRDKRYAC